MQLNKVECEKCKTLTPYISAIPNRANFVNEIEFKNAQVEAMEKRPDGLRCLNCGEKFS